MTKTTTFNRHERGVQLLLCLVLFVAYVYVLPRWAEWSQNSRLNLTVAIVDDGTLSIDKYYKNSGDYALFEGKHYTDKAPGVSFAAVPVYLITRPILNSDFVQGMIERLSRSPAFANTLNQEGTGLLTDKIYFFVVLYVCTIAVICLPSALLGVLLYRFMRLMGVSVGWAAAIALIYGLATNAFTYSAAFFGHQLVAFLLFGAFYIGVRVNQGAKSHVWLLLAGAMMGYALITEYPTALIVFGVGLYILINLLRRKQLKWAVPFMASALPAILLLAAYNIAIFRTPLPVGYKYSELYTDIHSQGLISLTYPHFEAVWGITFGPMRGLFYIAPVLLIAVLGFGLWFRSGKWRGEWAVCLWATLSFFLFNGSSIMWQGGFGVGPRYVVPMLPFFASAVGAFAMRFGTQIWARTLTGVLTIWSVAVVWALTLAGQNYPDWSIVPLTEYALPRLMNGDVARNLGMIVNLRGWSSLVPMVAGIALLLVLLSRQIQRPDSGEQAMDTVRTLPRVKTNEPAEA